MKKIFVIVMTMVMMAMMFCDAAFAASGLMNGLTLFDKVWISENFYFQVEDEDFINVVGDSIYIYGADMSLVDECAELDDKAIMAKLTEEAKKEGFKDPAVWCRTSENGKAIVVYIYAENDIRKLDGLKYCFNEYNVDENVEIHNFNVLCWRDWSSME